MPKPPVSPAPAGKPLNLRQQRFVQEYLVDGVAAAAARRAGYSAKSSLYSGHQLVRNPRIKAAIEAGRAARAAPMTRREAIEGLRRIAEANVLDYARLGAGGSLDLDLGRLERDRAGPVKGLTVTERTDARTGAVTRTVAFTLADRSAALAKLLPMLEADEAAAALARGRGEGIAAAAALSVEAFGRFKTFLAQAGRGRKTPAEGLLDAFLAREAAERPTLEQARTQQALAARKAELDDLAEQLDGEWDQISEERRTLTELEHRLVRREAEMAARR